MPADLPITKAPPGKDKKRVLVLRDPSPPRDETFNQRFTRRADQIGQDLAIRKVFSDADRADEAEYMRTQHGVHFDPRPDVPIEDQRNLTVGQLELQHAYKMAQGAYNRTPFDPAAPEPPLNPMGASMGAGLIPWGPGVQVPDWQKTETPNPAKPPLPRPRPKPGA